MKFFSTLYECLIPNLREITVAPAHLGFCAMIAANGYGYDQLADSYVFLLKFRRLFGSIGVQFSVITPEMERTQLRLSWANMD